MGARIRKVVKLYGRITAVVKKVEKGSAALWK